jgi:hypothetical protein
VRSRDRPKNGWFWLANGKLPDWPLLNDWNGEFEDGEETAGGLNCKGAGFCACASSAHPVKKLITEAIVSHTRMLLFKIFIFAPFRASSYVRLKFFSPNICRI